MDESNLTQLEKKISAGPVLYLSFHCASTYIHTIGTYFHRTILTVCMTIDHSASPTSSYVPSSLDPSGALRTEYYTKYSFVPSL